MKLGKHIALTTFTNPYKTKMFGVTFLNGDHSVDNYRGWSLKKTKKVAKMFKKLAQKIEALGRKA